MKTARRDLTSAHASRAAPLRALVALVAVLVGCATPQKRATETPRADDPAAAVGVIHRLLAPHGQWTRDDQHGWVWTPDPTLAGSDFVPYTGGRFVLTDAGLMFVSAEPWGWITYHYGRWAHDPVGGWHWVPGANWAPAWVGWRRGDGLVGWAPLPPRRRQPVRSAPSRWVFVAEPELGQAPLRERLLSRERLADVMSRTKPATQVVDRGAARWYRGPAAADLPTSMRADPAIELRLPPPGRLVRVRLSGSTARNEDRGAIVIRQPRADENGDDGQPKAPPAARPRRSRSIAGEVTPVMPPLEDDERGRRWR